MGVCVWWKSWVEIPWVSVSKKDLSTEVGSEPVLGGKNFSPLLWPRRKNRPSLLTSPPSALLSSVNDLGHHERCLGITEVPSQKPQGGDGSYQGAVETEREVWQCAHKNVTSAFKCHPCVCSMTSTHLPLPSSLPLHLPWYHGLERPAQVPAQVQIPICIPVSNSAAWKENGRAW